MSEKKSSICRKARYKKNLTEIQASRKSAAITSIIDVFGANRL
jgi:hypothetical protein